MEKERLIELGRQLGLENDALRKWVERECAQAREEEVKEREFAREHAEQQEKLKEQERKILELKLRLDESSRRLQPTATSEREGVSMSVWEPRHVLEKLARRIGLEGEELKVWVEERLAVDLAKEQQQIEYEREMKTKENEMIKKDKEVEELKTRTLGLNPSIEDCREVGSRGTTWSSHVLNGADSKSESEEHGSFIQAQLSCRASGKTNTFEEVGERLDYDGECRAENSEACAGHCTGVLLASLVHDHLRDPLVNGESCNSQDSTDWMLPKVPGQNEQGLIKAGTIEPAVCDNVSGPNDLNRKVDSVYQYTKLSVEGKLESSSVAGEKEQATVQTFASENQNRRTGTKAPQLSPMNETTNGASVFVQGFVSMSAHAHSEQFMSLDNIPVQVSRALALNPCKLCVDIGGGNFRKRLALGAWRQRAQFVHRSVSSSTQRPSILLQVHCCDSYGRRLLEALRMLVAKGRKSVVRLVWDAIT